MKRLLLAALLALALYASPAQAQCNPCCNTCNWQCPPFNICFCGFSISGGGGQTQLGPWYQYYPYAAHFQTPSPYASSLSPYNYQTLPPNFGQPGWGGGYQQAVPSYWYHH